MTPEELALIEADGAVVRAAPDEFAREFYDTLFELAPDTRSLFPNDMVVQRGKFVAELEFLVDAAVAASTSGDLGAFLERARDLGTRHVRYGVHGADYQALGVALLATVAARIDDWDEHHERAWSKLYRLISDVMREGADRQPSAAT